MKGRVDREMLQLEIALSATYLLCDEDKENLVSYFFKDLVGQDLGENVGEVVLGGDIYVRHCHLDRSHKRIAMHKVVL